MNHYEHGGAFEGEEARAEKPFQEWTAAELLRDEESARKAIAYAEAERRQQPGAPIDELSMAPLIREHLTECGALLIEAARSTFGQERRSYVGALAALETVLPDDYESMLDRVGTTKEELFSLMSKGVQEQRQVKAVKGTGR